MERTLARSPWLAGDTYSLADTAWTPILLRLESLNAHHLWNGQRWPHTTAYLERLRERDSFEAAITDYAAPKLIQRQVWDALWRHEGIWFTLVAATLTAIVLSLALLG